MAATMASDVYVAEGSGTMLAADSAVCMRISQAMRSYTKMSLCSAGVLGNAASV
jgi:hypothetical protein